jgi:S-DNA-T family DNA segregation ATPase FtsK/SpoIIIE
MFGTGGPLLIWMFTISKMLVGLVAFGLPILLVYIALEMFREEQNRISPVLVLGSVFCVSFVAGFAHLFVNDSTDITLALDGQGGGVAGFVVNVAMLSLFDKTTAGFFLGVLSLISLLFVLRISPKALFEAIKNFFSQDLSIEKHNQKVAEKAAAMDTKKTVGVGELKMNQGVPTMNSIHEEQENTPKKKASRLSSFKNTMEYDKNYNDEQTALVTQSDPDWQPPGLDLLEKKQSPADAGDVKHNAQVIQDTLAEFKIDAVTDGANIGPKVTQYTLKPPAGVKLSRITNLEHNIALNLAAQAIRIEAPIPGKRAVGIEVPNRKPADVRLHGILSSKFWKSNHSPLPFAVGKDISGEPVVGELNKMPHVLIAGQTGSGKSVMINALLSSLVYRNNPAEMKLILVDPKQVELTPYQDIPHLLTPVITKPEKCISALKWAVNEMERRYNSLAEAKVRDIKSYNAKNAKAEDGESMPYIVIIIDELSDLMMMAARDVEALIVRLAQKARAVGIHLVLATQRPSVDVITGLIKANIPARIAFTVASQVDSRTILDQIGAEKLLGQGDMLLTIPGMGKPKRVQGAFVSEDEVIKITDHLRMQRPPQYDDEVVAQQVQIGARGGIVAGNDSNDDKYQAAVEIVVNAGKASTSLLQRRLSLGYSRAASLIDQMEEQGIVGPPNGSKGREVLISDTSEVFGEDDNQQ